MIRQAVITDLDRIEEGYHDHFLYEKEHGAYTVFKEDVYPTRKHAEEALRNRALYVYEEKGIIAGSMILDKAQPDEYAKIDWPSQARPDQVSVIHLVMVHPGAARKGIGSALVNYAMEEAKRHSRMAVRLDTGEQNTPAVSLYRKLGFQLAGTSSMKVGGAILHRRHLFFEKNIESE